MIQFDKYVSNGLKPPTRYPLLMKHLQQRTQVYSLEPNLHVIPACKQLFGCPWTEVRIKVIGSVGYKYPKTPDPSYGNTRPSS